MNAARVMFAVIVLTLPGVVCAQATQASQVHEVENPIRRSAAGGSGAAPSATPASGVDVTRVVMALAAVIGLILVLRWCVRRIAPGAMGKQSRAVQVLARCHASHKQQILIVQVGRRLLVVGESAQGMNTLSEITDPDEVAVMMAQMGAREDVASALVSAKPQAEVSVRETIGEQSELSFARQQLNGLAEKVRVVARQLNRA